MEVVSLTKVIDVVVLACSISFDLAIVVRRGCFSSNGLVEYSTSITLELINSLFKAIGMSLGALFF